MGISFFHPESQQPIFNKISAQQKLQANVSASVTPELAQTTSDIYRRAAFLRPSQVLPLAKANASNAAIDLANQQASKLTLDNPVNDGPKGWWQRNIYDKVKTASRWTFSTLNLAPEVVQNMGAAMLNDASSDGFFKSTSLGTLLSDDEKAGEGFFIGGQAADLQAERARKYRGTIDDEGKKAFTLGRWAADLYLPDDSTAYHLMSGLVDGAVNYYADPTRPLGNWLKASRMARNGIEDTTAAAKAVNDLRAAGKMNEARLMQESIDAAEELAKSGIPYATIMGREEARALAGNISEQNKVWDGTEFMKKWGKTRATRNIENNIQKIVDGFTETKTALATGTDGLQGNELIIQTNKNLKKIAEERAYHAHRIQEEIFDGTISHEEALRFIDGGEGNQVPYVIAEAAARLNPAAGSGKLGMFPTSYTELPGASSKVMNRFAESTMYRVPGVKKFVERQTEFMSKSVMLVKGTPEDRFRAVQNIDRMLTLIKDKLPEDSYRSIIGRAAAAYNASTGSPTGIYEVRTVVKDAIATTLREGYDVPESAIKKLMANYDEQFTKLRTRITTEMGTNPGHSYIRSLINNGLLDEDDVIRAVVGKGTAIKSIDDLDGKIVSPTVISELLNNVQVLPDPRTLRRLTSDPFYRRTIQKMTGKRVGSLVSTAEGETRFLPELVEQLQTNVWKPFTLMNPGYIARNLLDGQFHIALSGDKSLNGLFNNPMAYFMYVMGKRAPESIMGEALTKGAKKKIVDVGTQGTPVDEIFFNAMGRNTLGLVGDPTDAVNRVMQSGDYVNVTRLENPENHTLGILDQLRMLNKDDILRNAMSGSTNPKFAYSKEVDRVMDYLATRPEERSKLIELARTGYHYGTDAMSNPKRIKVPMNRFGDEDMMLRSWVQSEVFGRVDKWQGTPEMRILAEHNRIPFIDVGDSRANIKEVFPNDIEDSRIISYNKKPGVGTIYRGAEPVGKNAAEVDYVVVDVRNAMVELKGPGGAPTGRMVSREVWDAVPVHQGESAWGKIHDPFNTKPYNDLAVQVVNKVYDSVDNRANQLIPSSTGYAVRVNPNDSKGMARIMDKWKNVTNVFFDTIAGGAMEKLEKSPLFRSYYYKYVKENADLLSTEQFDIMMNNIREGAQRMGITEAAYIGGRAKGKEFDSLLALRDKANGVGTVEQLNEWAANRSFISMKGMLFDAAQRRNVDDTLRVLAPFGAAWREVLVKYTKQFVEDPTNLRKVQRVFTGATNMDLEGDGTGFFYKDPQTNQYMFNYPLSDKFSQLFTGLTAPLSAPVKGLSVGLSFMPALGPVGQISANYLLPFVPKENDFRKVLLPYGTPGTGLSDFTPGYLRKTFDAIKANPDKMDGIYSQTYVETVRALYAKGEYDLANINDKERLLNDARGKARVLSLFRAVNQFFGPASGSVKFELDTKEGDMYMAELIKQFQSLQSDDYDKSVETFLDTYGDDMMLYISGKSKSQISGIEPTQKFDDWASENESLMKKYKGVSGFFAPGGDDFGFSVWKKQIDTGLRERLSASDVIDQAQLMVGSAKFRQARLQFGPYPNRIQQKWLREYRAQLNKELPGFPPVASFDPAEFPVFINQLSQAVNENKLQDNQVAEAARIYLEKRDQAFAAAQGAGYVGLSSKATTPLRNYLASIADSLIQKYPDFQRLFEQKLQAELMQYTEE